MIKTAEGLYDPRFEHDACGVGLLVNVRGIKSHQLVEKGLQVLEHMVHRGAEGADPKTGDGAGIMVQVPHEFILLQGIPVPEKRSLRNWACIHAARRGFASDHPWNHRTRSH